MQIITCLTDTLSVSKYKYSTQINIIVYQVTADTGEDIGMAMATQIPKHPKENITSIADSKSIAIRMPM